MMRKWRSNQQILAVTLSWMMIAMIPSLEFYSTTIVSQPCVIFGAAWQSSPVAYRSPLFSSSHSSTASAKSTTGATDNFIWRQHRTCCRPPSSPPRLFWRRRLLTTASTLWNSHVNGSGELSKQSKLEGNTGNSKSDSDRNKSVDNQGRFATARPTTNTENNFEQQSQQLSEDNKIAEGKEAEEDLSVEDLKYRLEQLQQENEVLLETVDRLEDEKKTLSQQAAIANAALQQPRVVLETFEGEGEEWCDTTMDDGSCPIEPTVSFWHALKERALWLVGLLVFQSFSGIILARNEALIADHPAIVYFLTMLVGAGGNAGNQASVRVIRGLALNTLNPSTQGQFLIRELKMAISLSTLLTSAGFIRAVVFATPFPETIAITTALFLIVFSSICLGAVLPLGLKRLGVDPAHSSTSIQVIMDILGVILAVGVSNVLLDSSLGNFLISKLTGGP